MNANTRIRVGLGAMHRMHGTMTMAQIGRRLGVSRQAVSLHFQKHGGKQHDHRVVYDTPLRKRIRGALLSKKPTSVIARELVCSTSEVRRVAHMHSLPITPPPAPGYMRYLMDKRWLRHRYVVQRKTSVEIGEELGCSFNPVLEWLHRHGIRVRSRGWLAGRLKPHHLQS